MRRGTSLIIVVMWAVTAAWSTLQAAAPQNTPPAFPAAIQPFRALVDQYCVACHNQRLKTAGMMLDAADLQNVPLNGEVWEKVIRKLRTGAMPPPGARRPDEAAAGALAAYLETELDRAAAARPAPGSSPMRRLNRAEYANAVRDLLAIDVDVTSLLPADNSAYGFDNIADALGVSPSLQERYLAAAETISALAVGDAAAGPASDVYRVRQDLSQNQHLEGLPLGTVGGMLVRHMFPLDGDYTFQARLYRTNFDNPRGIEHRHDVEVSVDGERVHVASIGGAADLAEAFEKPKETADALDARLGVRLRLKAGPHSVAIAFVEHFPVGDTTRLRPFVKSASDTLDWTGRPHLQSLTITGPFNATGAGDTPSRRKIFVCRPSTRSAEAACAKHIITTLARRAYRRPATDADLGPLMAFYEAGRREGRFETGIQRALQVILASPKFVFRIEQDPPTVASGAVHTVSDVDLASRLSFFLWSSIPDDQLANLANDGTLAKQAVLEPQVRRMLADPRSDALVGNFAGQWLQLRNVRNVLPNSDAFPDFDDNLRQAFRRETELLFASILHEDRNVNDLLTADYTFVNERLAKHYGIPNVYGSHFRRVSIADESRKGLLGHGSILALTSHATRTSPVVRGKWILENIMGSPPPAPPPDVPALKENEKGQTPRTMREQMAEHRANPVCAACHKIMDPIGFALEHFDAVGAWRTSEAGVPIDASGDLADGVRVDGVVTLRRALLRRPEVFVRTLTEKLLTYALGRGLDYHDMPVVRAIVRDAARSDYRFSSLILGVVNSVPFRMRMKSAL